MQIYLSYITDKYVPKNNLQKAVAEYLLEWDGKAFYSKDFENVKKQIIEKIHELNKKHKRSTPIEPEFFDFNQFVALIGVQSIRLNFIKGELCKTHIK